MSVTNFRRSALALLAGFVMLLAGGLPAAAVDAPDSITGLSATYDVAATLKWSARKLIVSSTALVTNNSGAPVQALTFNAAPMVIGRGVLGAVTVADQPATAIVDDQNIIVTLPTALPAAASVQVRIDYTATFGKTGGNKQWLFAKVQGIATAYRWIPWLSRAYKFRTPTYGEPFVTKTADDVRVRITSDRKLSIATSGTLTNEEGMIQTFWAHNVRDFNFAASPFYTRRTQRWGDININYYLRELPFDNIQKNAIASVERFSQRVGPYPYPDLSIAEVPTGPSMESPGMIWLTQNAVAKGNLKYLVVHELAHEWFYGVVGNDQAREPFADEAMAEFITRDLIGHRGSHCPFSVLDKRVYDYSASCYYEVVYVQGDLWLDDYRHNVGDAAFWDGIRRYYADYKFKIGGTLQLLQTLDAAAGQPNATHEDRFPSLYSGTGG